MDGSFHKSTSGARAVHERGQDDDQLRLPAHHNLGWIQTRLCEGGRHSLGHSLRGNKAGHGRVGLLVGWTGRQDVRLPATHAKGAYTWVSCDGVARPDPDMPAPVVDIAWVDPQGAFEAPLPAGVLTSPGGMCPVFLDAASLTASGYNTNVAAAIASPFNCTVITTLTSGPYGDDQVSYDAPYATICDRTFPFYWKGKAYRKARKTSVNGGAVDTIYDPWPVPNAQLLAYVASTKAATTMRTTSKPTTSGKSKTIFKKQKKKMVATAKPKPKRRAVIELA